LLQQKGFLHSSQDCTRAVLQQSKIGLTIEQRQDNHYDGSYVTLAGEIILEPKKGGLHTTTECAKRYIINNFKMHNQLFSSTLKNRFL
jgi:hypothetical protein